MRAIALFSGGLDSTLAAKLVINQGIEVILCNINTGFGSTRDRLDHMLNMASQIGAEFRSVDIRDEYIREVLFTPKWGYGKHFNPCIDCHGKMFEVAKRLLDEWGASFLISGEVLGQRPMSQNAEALKKVLDLSNCDGLLLRPLSAKALEPTVAEINGWVDRERLEGITGRNRERQMELANEFGLVDFESPGGGCLLTDEYFSNKIRDFIAYDKNFTTADIATLKYGRQFRLPDGAKLIIGRNADENELIRNIENPKYTHITIEIIGPHSMISSDASDSDVELASKIVLAYAKSGFSGEQKLLFGEREVFATSTMSKEDAREHLI